jgi:nucleolar protein 56
MYEKIIGKTKEKIRKKLSQKDNLIIQSIKTMDLLDKSSNLLLERLKEWYGIYHPELATADPDEYLLLLWNKPNDSMGAELKKKDIKPILSFAKEIKSLRVEREKISKYLEKLMKEVCPNITAVCGPIIGARLIASAGSLKRLAEFPSSTVQILGAEKAFFAHLRKNVKPPKHGIIFQHQKIRTAEPKMRGKLARKLAAKISIASRVDFFGGKFCGDRLASGFEV